MLPQSGCPVTGQFDFSRLENKVSSTGASSKAAVKNEGSGWYTDVSRSSRSSDNPSNSSSASLPNSAGGARCNETEAPVAAETSRLIVSRTTSIDSNVVCANDP